MPQLPDRASTGRVCLPIRICVIRKSRTFNSGMSRFLDSANQRDSGKRNKKRTWRVRNEEITIVEGA